MEGLVQALLPWWQSELVRYGVIAVLLLAGLKLAGLALRGGLRSGGRSRGRGRGGDDESAGTIIDLPGVASPEGRIRISDLVSVGNEIEAAIADAGRGGEPDVVTALARILSAAHSVGASDIHVTPDAQGAQVTYRVDGTLYDVARIAQDALARLASRVKVAADLSIYLRNQPQDGRLVIRFEDASSEVRVSVLPTSHGEKVVMRLHHASQEDYALERLGLEEAHRTAMGDLLARTQGIVFLTGPTGSGKTTTIYSALRHIRRTRGELTNIVTIEDPIEFDIPGVSQTQVDKGSGLTFADGLRSMLRQDPDVIVVGEIRDRETAQIALQAGLSGHLILTTLHAESATGVFTRLINMELEPFMLASATAAVMSQRLVRTNCPECRQDVQTSPAEARVLARAGVADLPPSFQRGAGCENCLGRGLIGRTALYELLVVDDAFRQLVTRNLPTSTLHGHAVDAGMITLLSDGLAKAGRGDVPLDEVLRVAV